MEKPSIGILYCGDMGAAVARELVNHGFLVSTTSAGRSEATRLRAQNSGARILDSVEEVVEFSDIIVSLTLPSVAIDLARQVATRATPMPKYYIDVNSTAPEVTVQIEKIVGNAGFEFVNGTIHGVASRIPDKAVFYLSGSAHEAMAAVFSPAIRVVDLGAETEAATKMKCLLAGVSKGLSALFVEIAGIADAVEMLSPFLGEFESFYPELSTVLDRLIKTYPQHAARRVSELKALASLAHDNQAPMIIGATRHIARLAENDWSGLSASGTNTKSVMQNYYQNVQSSLVSH